MSSAAGYDYVVDAAGGGDYERVQAAIDGAKSFPRERVTVFVRSGVYEEQVTVPSWNTDLTLVGAPDGETVLTRDVAFEDVGRGRNSTFHTATLRVCGDGFRTRDLTVRNDANPDRGQAVALHAEADRAVFEDCRFNGHQDTVYLGEGARQYVRGCHVEGDADFVFGGATAVFEDCTVHSKADSSVTAASTPRRAGFGFVFRDCTLTADEGVSLVYLGRPWRDHAHVAFIGTHLGAHVHPDGWHDWDRSDTHETVTFVECATRGPGARPASARVPWATTLPPEAAERYALESVLGGVGTAAGDDAWFRVTETA